MFICISISLERNVDFVAEQSFNFWRRDIKLLHLFIFYKKQGFRNKVVAIQINHQLDTTIPPLFYLTFIYSSTCFGRPHAHHQELNNCSSSLWFYLRSVVIAVLLVVVGPAGRPDHDQQHCYHYAPKVKPEAATGSCWATDDGHEDARNMLNCK